MAEYLTIQERVNAEKWKGDNYSTILDFLGWDVWDKRDNSASGPNFSIDNSEGGDGILYVANPTLTAVDIGDYIIKEADGSLTVTPGAEFEAEFKLA